MTATIRQIEINKFFTDQHLPGSDMGNFLTQLFHDTNQTLPDYEKFSRANSKYLQNYISIKFPHTSWMTPVDMKQSVRTISPIEASNTPQITINKNINYIFLAANSIQSLNFSNFPYKVEILGKNEYEGGSTWINNGPLFVPVNYTNQNYMIDKIIAPNFDIHNADELHQFMQHFFPMPYIKEPIHIIIKELQTNSAIYKDILIFTYQTESTLKNLLSPLTTALATSTYPDHNITGYIYTLNQKTHIVYWRVNVTSHIDISDPKPSYSNESFPVEKLKEWIAQVENKATQNIKNMSHLKDTLQTMQQEPIPERISKSRENFQAKAPAAVTHQAKYSKTAKGWIKNIETKVV